MKIGFLLFALIFLSATTVFGEKEHNKNIVGYYTRLPFDDHDFDRVTLAHHLGETWYRYEPQPDKELTGDKNLQYINLKSITKQFQIGEIGSKQS